MRWMKLEPIKYTSYKVSNPQYWVCQCRFILAKKKKKKKKKSFLIKMLL